MDDDTTTDQRAPHQKSPHEEVSFEQLEKLGVMGFSGISSPEDPFLLKIIEERGYSYTDNLIISPTQLPDYENKIKSFYREHIHYDEEIRYCMDGTGYFDIRSADDRWIRIAVEAGDMIILPEGIYHRFTCDAFNYMHAMRFFVGEPVWTPYNRDEIDEVTNPSRQKYVTSYVKTQ